MFMKALLLSAGLGTRLRPITKKIPKVMVQLDGKPCIQYHIENLREQGVRDFAINTHHFPEQIKEHLGDGSKYGVNLRYSFEPELLGTSGALNNFLDFFEGEEFLVVYADVFADFKVNPLIETQRRSGSDISIVVDDVRDKKGRGLVTISGDKVTGFVEKPPVEIPWAMINSGFYLVNPKILDYIEKGFSDFGKDILPKIAKEGKLSAIRHEGYIFDIGKIEDLSAAEAFLRKGH